ncbi:hypothetical protein DPEC_G00135220 [Dallia pectoralis]|uniref:Uncharacterized protein n=1 Tax=Dallia pectoralis TaxID=75939 RepID=A0ACC2GL64_DALPE|nr:hypothetical protein DPEC_G00135220 [Dallia pectoralis]
MDHNDSLDSLDGLLLQLALQTREITEKRDQLNHQIQISKANVAEKKSFVEVIRGNIQKLEEESDHKQKIVKHLKDSTKRLKGTNTLLLQYEKTLQGELEKRQDHCNQDMKVYQERIESYRKVYQQHKERYCQNPQATNLLLIQGEKEEIERRIKAVEERIKAKEKLLQDLLGHTLPTDKQVESILGVQTAADSYKQSDPVIATDLHSSLDTCSLRLSQDGHSKQGHGPIEENQEMVFPPTQEAPNSDLWSDTEIIVNTADQVAGLDQHTEIGLEELMNISGPEEGMEEMKERGTKEGEEQPTPFITQEENEGMVAAVPPQTFPKTTARKKSPLTPARMQAAPSTPTFSLKSTPRCLPGHPDGSTVTSPGFVFSLTSGPSPTTPAFSGFDCGFDMGSAPEEETPFSFTSSYFSNEKKLLGSKSPNGFPFARPEKSEDGFEFPFNSGCPNQPPVSREKREEDSFAFFNF